MKLPKHVAAEIEHNPHRIIHQSVAEYLENSQSGGCVIDFVSDEDKARCLESNELWVVTIYPVSPVGHWDMAGSSLELILEAINQPNRE